ncbi:hypothetical protein GCM10027020_06450 [Nocardioides salsibiostraticola]
MFIVSGFHLDRAWPDLGLAFGKTWRSWSRTLLSEVVDRAQLLEADTILVLGDLVDRETVLPDTLDFATQTLGSFPGTVLIAPGRRDWAGAAGPYERATLAANTKVWGSESYAELPAAPGVFGSAWTSPAPDSEPPRQGGPTTIRRIWVRAGSEGVPLSVEATNDLLISSGQTARIDEGVLVVPQLVSEAGAVPRGLLLDLSDETVDARIVELSDPPGARVDLDVTTLTSTQALDQALKSSDRGPTPVYLALVGTLAPGVLLPGSGGPVPGEAVHLDLSALTYADPPRRSGDHSMVAEFLRAMAECPDDARTRHQVTALGLRALNTESNDPTS